MTNLDELYIKQKQVLTTLMSKLEWKRDMASWVLTMLEEDLLSNKQITKLLKIFMWIIEKLEKKWWEIKDDIFEKLWELENKIKEITLK